AVAWQAPGAVTPNPFVYHHDPGRWASPGRPARMVAMCGRFSCKAKPKDITIRFGLDPDTLPPRYNVVPRQPVAVVRPSALNDRNLVILRIAADPPGHPADLTPAEDRLDHVQDLGAGRESGMGRLNTLSRTNIWRSRMRRAPAGGLVALAGVIALPLG